MRVAKGTEAGSPVHGIIAIVAITIVLGMMIAAFGFGIAGAVTKTTTVTAMADQVGKDITVTWQGGPDNAYVSYYHVTLHDTPTGPGSVTGYPPIAGSTAVFPGQGTDGKDHVVVTAVFSTGPAQVVLDTYV